MTCPSCGEPLYDSGHAHDDCPGSGQGCQECGWGCDLDFADDGGCAQLDEQNDDEEVSA